jgi:hypothetical protein
MTYRPLRFFLILGGIVFGVGLLIGFRFLYFVLTGSGGGHVQSLILASTCMVMGFMTWVMGLIADVISVNRRLLEEINTRLWKLEEAAHAQHKEGS